MHPQCTNCGEDFKKEVGFYYGAMYAAYAVSGFFAVGAVVLFVYFLDVPLKTFFYFLIPGMIILLPWFYRTSRLLWINIFVRYDKEK